MDVGIEGDFNGRTQGLWMTGKDSKYHFKWIAPNFNSYTKCPNNGFEMDRELLQKHLFPSRFGPALKLTQCTFAEAKRRTFHSGGGIYAD